jgi:hypothetical protein
MVVIIADTTRQIIFGPPAGTSRPNQPWAFFSGAGTST